jgi:hypothetical protein
MADNPGETRGVLTWKSRGGGPFEDLFHLPGTGWEETASGPNSALRFLSKANFSMREASPALKSRCPTT